MADTKAQTADTSIPTPWHVDPDDRPDMEYNNHIAAANGNAVCFMAWSGDAENNEAHEKAAALIAAAPETAAERDRLKEINAELLATLESINRCTSPGSRTVDGLMRDMGLACDIARAAIAKAQGRDGAA